MKILIVEDDTASRIGLESVLRDKYVVKSASSGEQALEIAGQFKPDLVLLDVVMPGINGYEVCRQIRSDESLKHIKIVMLSANTATEDRLEGYQAGADDYLTKPFDKDELLAKVRVYLRLKSVEELDEMKNNVLGLFCHETLTPLNTIMAPAELLMADDEMDVDQRKALAEMIYNSSIRLFTFMQKTMKLNSLKSGDTEFDVADADLRDVVSAALAEVNTKASDKDIKINQNAPVVSMALIDFEEIKNVLVDILDNAICFSPTNGIVKVDVSCENQIIYLRIIDTGEGIDPTLIPYLFDAFTDNDFMHHADSNQHISLAIAYQVISAHKGNIHIESVKGNGTTCTIELPMAPALQSSVQRQL
jgi:two-component system sensor histidine kinase/response regulator